MQDGDRKQPGPAGDRHGPTVTAPAQPPVDLSPSGPYGSAAAETAVLWGVGAVSQRLGIATPTLRTWDRRYGLGPSARTAGGHRRYSELDVARLARMSQLIAEGVPPSRAAQVSQRSVHDPAAVLTQDPSSPLDDSALSGRGVSLTINAMMRAARELDPGTLSKMLAQVLDRRGVVVGWTEVVSPFLVEIGAAWEREDLGVEVEHLASDCVQTELRHRVRYRHNRRSVTAPVLLASAADEQHCLPVAALAAALIERRINTLVLGARTPPEAITATIEHVSPRVVFCWSSMDSTADMPRLGSAAGQDVPLAIMLGGPGWGRPQPHPEPPVHVERVSDLAAAVECITAIVG